MGQATHKRGLASAQITMQGEDSVRRQHGGESSARGFGFDGGIRGPASGKAGQDCLAGHGLGLGGARRGRRSDGSGFRRVIDITDAVDGAELSEVTGMARKGFANADDILVERAACAHPHGHPKPRE